MKKSPLLSIIVPLYNKAQYLQACLESIRSQTEKNWECIIVNDGSTDSSLSIAESFADRDPRFKIINQKNSGPSTARNQGIKKAKGELLHFIDADDFYPANTTLEEIVKIYTKDRPKAIAGNMIIHTDNGKSIKYDVEINSENIKYMTFAELQNDYFFTRFFFNRKFIKDNKILFPEYTYVGEDPVFLVKALSKMDKFLVTNITVYIYNHVEGSVSELSGYDDKKTESYMTTQLEILQICKKENYQKLQKRILDRIDNEMIDLYVQKKETNRRINAKLEEILSYINPDIYYERLKASRALREKVMSLEAQTAGQASAINPPELPGVKESSRLLAASLKRRIKKIVKKYPIRSIV